MARNRKETKILFVHCTGTVARRDIGSRTIHKMHIERGIFSERGMTGYHFIGRRSGRVELGRELREMGAHVRGKNDASIGYVLVGGCRKAKNREQPTWADFVAEDNFTVQQKSSLACTIQMLKLVYPEIVAAPHNLVSNKACPSFDVWAWQQETFGYNDELRARAIVDELEDAQ